MISEELKELRALKEKVKLELPDDIGKTIPELCSKFKIEDEFKMMRVIAELQSDGVATLDKFDKIYREDGGAIYLAKYKKLSPSAATG